MAETHYAEYASPDALVAALTKLRAQELGELHAYTPYPVEDARRAVGLPRSRLPWAIFVVGIGAALGAYGLQWLVVAYLYPLNVGGRPAHMPLAYIIITFEMGVLFAAFTAFFGVLYKARLLRLWDPLFEVDGFGETSIDRHWLRLVTEDPGIDAERVARSLDETNPIRVIRPEQPHGGEP